MRNLLVFLSTITTLLTSCATLLSSRDKDINIHTSQKSQVVINEESLQSEEDSYVTFTVKRDKTPLDIKVLTSDTSYEFQVRPRNSFLYWSNIFNYCIGMLVDANNPKRYTYPTHIHVDNQGKVNEHYFPSPRHGALDVYFSIPYVNSFYLSHPSGWREAETGFLGYSIGFDYHYPLNSYFQVNYAHAINFPFFVPGPINYKDPVQHIKAKSISLSHNHKIKRLSLGYGLSYTWYRWEYSINNDPDFYLPNLMEKINYQSLGFVFPAYYHIGQNFRIGLTYKPSFYRPNFTEKWAYDHTISFDFALRLRLAKW